MAFMGQEDALGDSVPGLPLGIEEKTSGEILTYGQGLYAKAKDDLKFQFSIIVQEADHELRLVIDKYRQALARSKQEGVNDETRTEVERMGEINLQDEINKIKQQIKDKMSQYKIKS